MKTIVKSIFLLASALCVCTLYAQEKPIRTGVKIGYPNALGGNVEYVTPLFGKKLAPSIEYSTISANQFIDPDKGKLSYFQAGFNYYLFKEGKGLYSNLSYGMLKVNYTTTEATSESDESKIGNGIMKLVNNSLNLKLGAKLGKGFYFRPELGYAFKRLPETLNLAVSFPDGTSEIQQEDIPKLMRSGLMFNIGFGAAF